MTDTAIIGAGPYGLSVAAHFRRAGIPFRIFGQAMDSWKSHMPKGMLLKSDGFASNLYDPNGEITLQEFCSRRGIEYSDKNNPIRLETFTEYGLDFQNRVAPELEEKNVVAIERGPKGFQVRLENGEEFIARRIVLAVGTTHFDHVPPELAQLPAEFVCHSSQVNELQRFKDRSVVVVGAGASALDLAGLLDEAGAHVMLISRRKTLNFHTGPSGKPRTLWQRLRHPDSGLGPGLRSYFYSNAPMLFHYLPQRLRVDVVRNALGPSGGWFTRGKVIGRVPLMLGHKLDHTEIKNGQVHLRVIACDGRERVIFTDHVIAATGYKVDVSRLTFLSEEILASLKTVEKSPVLSSQFESSVPGLHFVGIAAANSFGPVMRFVYGAGFTARRLTHAFQHAPSAERMPLATPVLAPSKNEESRSA